MSNAQNKIPPAAPSWLFSPQRTRAKIQVNRHMNSESRISFFFFSFFTRDGCSRFNLQLPIRPTVCRQQQKQRILRSWLSGINNNKGSFDLVASTVNHTASSPYLLSYSVSCLHAPLSRLLTEYLSHNESRDVLSR